MARRTPLLILTTLASATVLSSLVALAETGASAPGSHGPHRSAHRGGLFARIDKNGDGKIERSEARAAATDLHSRMDKNGDGQVTPDEQGKQPKRAHAGQPGDKHFARMDKNGDGKIERGETRMPEERFVKADTNKDGKLTRAELQAAFEAKMAAHAKERFAQFDANKDGKIDRNEAVAHADSRFTALDANKDGQVSAEEAGKGFPGMKRGGHGKRHDCGGEKTAAPLKGGKPA